jgi:membrane protein
MSGGPDKEPVDGLEDGALVLPVPAQERSLSLAEPPEPAPPRSWRERWRCFPWRNTAHTLRERFREDRLGVTASSLTFTTVLALVPFFTVALALFTAFPIFSRVQIVLERWLIDSLIPETIARQVLGYLTQFASKASQLGMAGFSILVITAVALILTIDRTLNNNWRVRQLRPLGQRVLIYWAAITLGPLVLGLSLVLSSYVMSASRGLVNALPEGLRFIFDSIEFLALAAGMAGLYHYVPNTAVRWRHAWVGGLFVATCMELAKKALGLYLASVPTYSVIYGTFATLPILLIWIYMAWVIVLLGAVVTAYLPIVMAGVQRVPGQQGWQFEMAVEILQYLAQERESPAKGLYASDLARRLRVDWQQIDPVLQALSVLDWVGTVQAPGAVAASEGPEPRYMLLVEPQRTPLEPLVQRLLLAPSPAVQPLWDRTGLAGMTLSDLLERRAQDPV